MEIKNFTKELPWHADRVWKKRELKQIRKIIIHQEMGNSSIEQVNEYHITPGQTNHISTKGCPHFCYHFGIRSTGEIIQANEFSDITWHCFGQNTSAIGIMLQGNFSGPGHVVGTKEPEEEQMKALSELVDFLLESLQLANHDVFGHYYFGKPACPGTTIQAWIEEKRNHLLHENSKEVEKTVSEIQKRLNTLGYSSGKADGIMGVKTLSAIKRFQAENELEVDGIVGPQSWNTLLTLSQNS